MNRVVRHVRAPKQALEYTAPGAGGLTPTLSRSALEIASAAPLHQRVEAPELVSNPSMCYHPAQMFTMSYSDQRDGIAADIETTDTCRVENAMLEWR